MKKDAPKIKTAELKNDSLRYDLMPYQSQAFPITLPNYISAVATLFGLTPSKIRKARVLELGCASGGNIIPLAIYYPEMQIVGIDYSHVQINQGLKEIEQLGLKNITLQHLDISKITPDLGQFDYIICHGVYSWVPDEIQQAILRVCKENLTENGIAYVSYNTYPGWKTKEIMRDAMMFHTRGTKIPQEQLQHGIAMLQFLNKVATPDSVFKTIITNETNNIDGKSADYISHEYLETHNQPCYFKDFIENAQQNDLTYIAESQFIPMFAENIPEDQRLELAKASNGKQIDFEQYLDFITNRQFRQTLLTHKAQQSKINYQIQNKVFESLSFHMDYVAVKVDSSNNTTLDASKGKSYHHKNDEKNTINATGIYIYLFDALQNTFSSPISYNDLIEKLTKTLGNTLDKNVILESLKNSVLKGIVLIKSEPINERLKKIPSLPKMHVKMIAYGQIKNLLTNRLNETIKIDDVLLVMLPLLDGQHTHQEIEDEIYQAILDQKLQIFDDKKQPLSIEDEINKERIKKGITEITNRYLALLLQFNLFIK